MGEGPKNDRLGNVIALSDSSGAMTSEMTYEVYGEPKQPLPVAFGYTGHRHEQDLGLIDANGRFYDPQFGVFLSADPVSPFGGGSPRMNRYAYVGYDPINYTDPTGYSLLSSLFSAVMYGAFPAALSLVPMYNYVTTGVFSLSWTREVLATGGAAGAAFVVCGTLFSATGPGALLMGAACSGMVAGTVGTAIGGGDGGDIMKGAMLGLAFGLAGGVVGIAAGSSSFLISSNPYAAALLTVGGTAGGNAGIQLLVGNEVDWGMVSGQAAVSTVLVFYKIHQAQQQAQEQGQGQGQGQAVGKSYSKASRPKDGFPRNLGASGDVWEDIFGDIPLPERYTVEPPFDAGTEARLGTLRADTQEIAREHLETARAAGLDPRIGPLGGSRTTAGQVQAGSQTAIAARPGNSAHEYGAAYDIVLFDNDRPLGGREPYAVDMYRHLQDIGVDIGVNLGPPGDYGHFQMPNWRGLNDLNKYRGPQL